MVEERAGKNKGGHEINSFSTPFNHGDNEDYQTFILILLYEEFRTQDGGGRSLPCLLTWGKQKKGQEDH